MSKDPVKDYNIPLKLDKFWLTAAKKLEGVIGEPNTMTAVAYAREATEGNKKLWVMFWLWGVLGGLIWSLLIFSPLTMLLGPLGYILAALLYLPYFAWVNVSIWNSATNTEKDFFGFPGYYLGLAARVLVVLSVLQYLLGLGHY